ncbi:MAG: hypothetical protein OQK69_10325 [Gammaproteobacteria bacterium]|nr:hypothetical protein [Gammaproteobacteria bacterium]
MSYSTDDKNENTPEPRSDHPDRRMSGERRRETRKGYIDGEFRDYIPRRMSDFSEIMLDDDH